MFYLYSGLLLLRLSSMCMPLLLRLSGICVLLLLSMEGRRYYVSSILILGGGGASGVSGRLLLCLPLPYLKI